MGVTVSFKRSRVGLSVLLATGVAVSQIALARPATSSAPGRGRQPSRGSVAAPKARAWTGTVASVVEGGLLKVRRADGTVELVQVYGVATPHPRQDFGDRCRQYVTALLKGKAVQVEPRGAGPKGGAVAVVWLGGQDLGGNLLTTGLAWAVPGKSPAYSSLEAGARRARVGLWGGPNPVAPWKWHPPAVKR